MAQRSGKVSVSLYEGKHFTERKLEVFRDCDNFRDRGFMNQVNSIRMERGAWVCFDHPDFQGQLFILEQGDYPDFFHWNSHSDHMGSCQPVGMACLWPAARLKKSEPGVCRCDQGRSPTG
nr:gamma-crystallin N [Saimiri boliviensis boliviensis]